MDISPVIPQQTRFIQMLIEEAVKTFGSASFETQIHTLSEEETHHYIKNVISASMVNRILHKYAISILEFLKNNHQNPCFQQNYCENTDNLLDLYYIRLSKPYIFNSLGFISEIALQKFDSVDNFKLIFDSKLTEKITDFEKIHFFLMRQMLSCRKNYFDITMTSPEEKLDVLLALEGYALITGPEFSGKSRFVQNYLSSLSEYTNECAYIAIDKTTDLSTLLGNYVISTSNSEAKFDWKEGNFVESMKKGRICVLENFELASEQLQSFISGVISNKSLKVKNKSIYFHHNFRLILVTREPIERHKHQTIDFPKITFEKLVFSLLQENQLPDQLNQLIYEICRVSINSDENANFHLLKKLVNRLIPILKMSNFRKNENDFFISSNLSIFVLFSTLELFFENNLSDFTKNDCFNFLCSLLNLKPVICTSMLETYQTTLKIENNILKTTRLQVNLPSTRQFSPEFVLTPKTSQLIETILTCVTSGENTLLIGETGCGKTTVIQELSRLFNKKINVFNVSHSTDAFDLFGGYRPIDQEITFRHEIDQIESVLNDFFSIEKNQQFLITLREFLVQKKYSLLAKSMIQACQRVIQKIDDKITKIKESKFEAPNKKSELAKLSECRLKMDALLHKNTQFLIGSKKNSAQNNALNLEFVKGVILNSIEKNEWLLLDEINLANEEVLFRLYQVLFEDRVYVSEASDFSFIRKHADFRLFACMNPAFEVGKKPLPKRIKEGFTTINVSALDTVEEVTTILRDFFKNFQSITQTHIRKLSEFYCEIRKKALTGIYLDKNNKKVVFTLRQLRRASNIIKEALCSRDILVSLINCFYTGMRLSFYLDLNLSSENMFNEFFNSTFDCKNVEKMYLDKNFYQLSRDFELTQKYVIWQDFPIRRFQNSTNQVDFNQILEESDKIVVTPNIRTIICDLHRILLYDGSRPILLEGPTSVGKTSIIVFLAKLIGQKVVRLNNHRDTDIDEYIGAYVPDRDGSIKFQEGVLLQCMRNGSWLLLDELNLARSEILEALNRVLDDNQELFVPELDAMIKPAPGFRIFATQNPNSYSGRSLLSTAFRNRFIVVNFESHNEEDLKSILVAKASVPESRAKMMLKIMTKLETIRSSEKVFEGKEGLITIRDLLKWGARRDENASTKQLARVGYFLLGERIRDFVQKKVIKKVISTESGIVLEDDVTIYEEEYKIAEDIFPKLNFALNYFGIKLNTQFKRLFILTNKSFVNKEAVLLIGQTGCGKTTLAQMLAHIYQVPFYSINCHKHTEVSDFLGGWKPSRGKNETLKKINAVLLETDSNFAVFEEYANYSEIIQFLSLNSHKFLSEKLIYVTSLANKLKSEFEWVEGNLVEAVRNGGVYLIDEISLANDSVLERLNSLLESTRELSLQESDQNFHTIKAHPRFVIIATMNPSGDYGKRELSPALRNRFTEIWATSVLDPENFFSDSNQQEVKIFIHSFSKNLIEQFVVQKSKLAEIFEKITYFLYELFNLINAKYNEVLKNLNMRDLTTICHIFAKNFDVIGFRALHVASCVIFEAIISQTNEEDLKSALEHNFEDLHFRHFGLKTLDFDVNGILFQINEHSIKFGMIQIERKSIVSNQNLEKSTFEYLFDDPQIKQNLFKFLLGLQSNKPILIEGNPGTGKTSMIETIAQILRINVYRIGLSEQTDLIDLLGNHIPDQQNFGFFSWKDGLLLKALKEGAWIIFDELNLANQTILEGLNSILDHRGEVFLPDLNQTIVKSDGFRFFGTQNPAKTTKNRKGLPASFLNRFFKIYTKDFKKQTLENIVDFILQKKRQSLLETKIIFDFLFVLFYENFSNLSVQGNIRFFTRIVTFLDIFYIEKSQIPVFLEIICQLFLEGQFRINSKSLKECLYKFFSNNKNEIDISFAFSKKKGIFCYLKNQPTIQICCDYLKNVNQISTFPIKHFSKLIFSISTCIQADFPVLFECKNQSEVDTIGTIIENLAKTSGTKLKRLLLYKTADIADLIGNYEQCNWEVITKQLFKKLIKKGFSVKITNNGKNETIQQLEDILTQIGNKPDFINLKDKILNVIQLIRNEKSIFQWTFSPLMKAILKGDWVLVQSCEQANSAVLEKLNGLLEKAEFMLSECHDEDGSIAKIKKHKTFKLFFIFNGSQKNFEVPVGLQNRCFSIKVDFYLNEGKEHKNTIFRNYLSVLSRLRDFEVYEHSDLIKSIEPEKINQLNIVSLGELALELKESRAIVLAPTFPELKNVVISPEVINWESYLEKLIRLKLKQFQGFDEENSLNSEIQVEMNDFLSKEDIQSKIFNILEKKDKNKFWKNRIKVDCWNDSTLFFLEMTSNTKHLDSDMIEKVLNFTNIEHLFDFINQSSQKITKVNLNQNSSYTKNMTDAEKILELTILRLISSHSSKLRLYTTNKHNNYLFEILTDEVFNAKERFVRSINPNLHSNFITMLSPVLKNKEVRAENSLQTQIISNQKIISQTIQTASLIAEKYQEAIINIFENNFSNFKKNYMTILDEYEDSNITVFIQNEENLNSFLSILLNRSKMLLTEYEQHDEIFTTYFQNLVEFSGHFAKIIDTKSWLNWTSGGHFKSKAFLLIILRLKTNIQSIFTISKFMNSFKFTIREYRLLNNFIKKILSDLPSLNFDLNEKNINFEYFNQLLSSIELYKQESETILNAEVQREMLLCSVKQMIEDETFIYKQENLDICDNMSDYGRNVQIFECKTQLLTFLSSLVNILDFSFKNQIMIESASLHGKTTNSKFIGQTLFNLGYDRLSSIANTSSQRINDKLSALCKKILTGSTIEIKDELAQFLFEILENGEYLFNQFIDERLIENLISIITSIESKQPKYEIIGFYKSEQNFEKADFRKIFLKELQIITFEAKFDESQMQKLSNNLSKNANYSWQKIITKIEELKIAYRAQIKSSGISEAAKRIKLEEQLERTAKYEYDKKTVDENRIEKEKEFRQTFNLAPSNFGNSEKNQKNDEEENVVKKSSKYHKNFQKFWSFYLPFIAFQFDIKQTINITTEQYLRCIKEVHFNDFGINSTFELFENMMKNVIVKENRKFDILKVSAFSIKNEELPINKAISNFIKEKQKLMNSFNFYEESSNYQQIERLVGTLNEVIEICDKFHRDVAFTDMSSLNSLIKACTTVSEIKIDCSFANICTALEIILRNIDEFEASLPESMRMIKQKDLLRAQLLDLRRQEKHKWQDFVFIKKHELMNEDLGEFLDVITPFSVSPIGMKMNVIESVLINSTLLNFQQRLLLGIYYIEKFTTGIEKQTLLHMIGFYASFSDELQDKIKSYNSEIEDPMKNSMKLMNWHFEDVINIKMNVEKLYRGIHKSIKMQKEVLERPFRSEVLMQQRTGILFQSIQEAHANFSGVVLTKKDENIKEKKIAKKNQFLTILSKSYDFKTNFNEKDISFLKMISASKILALFGISQTKEDFKFKNNLLFKDELTNLMRNYLDRMNELAGEKKRSFIQRALGDFLGEVQNFRLKSRFNYQNSTVAQKVFEKMAFCELKKIPQQILNSKLSDDINSKAKKINLRLCKIVDCLKNYVENQQYSQDIAPDLREKLISFGFCLYFKLCEHNRQFSLISGLIEQIINDFSKEKKLIIEKKRFIEFLIETNIELSKTEKIFTQTEIRSLLEIKQNIESDNFSEAMLKMDSSKIKGQFWIQLKKELSDIISLQTEQNSNESSQTEIFIKRQKNLLNLKISRLKAEYENGKNENYIALQFGILHVISTNLSAFKKITVSKDLQTIVGYELSVQILHTFDWIYKFNKFVYLISLIFTNMIYKGFCIPKDSEEEEKPAKDQTELRAGTGIGEGQGTQNVTDELEFEEQVLGTKNEQKDEDLEDEQNDPLKKDEDEMSMENDFEGTTDRKKEDEEQKDEKEQKKEEQAQDEFTDVDERKSDLELFQDEEDEQNMDEEEENKKDPLKKADDLELNAQQLNKEKEQLKAKTENDNEVRNLDKDGANLDQPDLEASDMMDVESLEEQSNQEEFAENMPDVNEQKNEDQSQTSQLKDEMDDIDNDQNLDRSIELSITDVEDNIDEGNVEEIKEESLTSEYDEKGMSIEEIKTEQKEKEAQKQEALQIKDSGNLGAQQNQTEVGNFGDIDQKDQTKTGFGGKKQKNEQSKPEENFQKNLNRIFKQNLRIKETTVQKIIEKFNLHAENEEESLQPEVQNLTDFELEKNQNQEKQEFAAKTAGFTSTDQDCQPLDLEKELDEKKDKNIQDSKINQTQESPSLIDNLLQKRVKNEENEVKPGELKKIKTTDDNGLRALEEYAQINSQKDNIGENMIIEDKSIVNSEKYKLCEELKSILEQKKMSDLKGDYRTGKRLNMKRVISYIASNYRKDKIWLRRTEPNQQNYRIFIAVDDSSSMK